MNNQRFAGAQLGKKVFRAARQIPNGLPDQPRAEPARKRHAQIGPPDFSGDDARAGEPRIEPAPDRFDLGEFRHVSG